MHVFAIIPVNELSKAKTRLLDVFTGEEKSDLVLCMLEDVLSSLKAVHKIVIISPARIEEMLQGDFDFIIEEEKYGLNSAIEMANRYCIENGASATLFIPADLPLIKENHVVDILELGRENPVVISPSRDNGTSILLRRPPDIIQGRFIPRSFYAHVEEARSKGVKFTIYSPFALSLDIDTPEDVAEFMRHGRGTKTYDFLREFKARFEPFLT